MCERGESSNIGTMSHSRTSLGDISYYSNDELLQELQRRGLHSTAESPRSTDKERQSPFVTPPRQERAPKKEGGCFGCITTW